MKGELQEKEAQHERKYLDVLLVQQRAMRHQERRQKPSSWQASVYVNGQKEDKAGSHV